jgi:hypothetical protein
MTISAEHFRATTGLEPARDDLQRCNCIQAGEFGHWYCGWCAPCDRPRFVCGHFHRNEWGRPDGR